MRILLVFVCFVFVSVQLAFGARVRRAACPGGIYAAINPECCKYYDIRDDLQTHLFDTPCNSDAREILRLSFHDAVGYSASGKLRGGGADGSIIAFNTIESGYVANSQIEDAIHTLKLLLTQYNTPSNNTITPGDLVHLSTALGLSTCPGAPRLSFLAGRPYPTIPSDDHTVPLPEDSVDDILARVGDAGLSPEDLVWLLASHSIGYANDIAIQDGGDAGPKQEIILDSTPSSFDTQFYLEVLLRGTGYPGRGSDSRNQGAAPGETMSPLPLYGELRLISDFAIARDERTSCSWQSVVNDQSSMSTRFASSMLKLSLIGQDPSKLTDCSEVIPDPPPLLVPRNGAFYPPGKSYTDVEQTCSSPFPALPSEPSLAL